MKDGLCKDIRKSARGPMSGLKAAIGRTRVVRGAYVDASGGSHACDGPGRTFKEGAVIETITQTTSTRMVRRIVREAEGRSLESIILGIVSSDPFQMRRAES